MGEYSMSFMQCPLGGRVYVYLAVIWKRWPIVQCIVLGPIAARTGELKVCECVRSTGCNWLNMVEMKSVAYVRETIWAKELLLFHQPKQRLEGDGSVI